MTSGTWPTWKTSGFDTPRGVPSRSSRSPGLGVGRDGDLDKDEAGDRSAGRPVARIRAIRFSILAISLPVPSSCRRGRRVLSGVAADVIIGVSDIIIGVSELIMSLAPADLSLASSSLQLLVQQRASPGCRAADSTRPPWR